MVIENRLRDASPNSVLKDPAFLDIGGQSNARYRDLVFPDLNGYKDLSIEKATLSLYWYYPAGSSRSEDTVIEVYRPASAWNSNYVSWNKRDNGVAWKNPGGDWYDKNGVLQGSTPYATLTFKASTLPNNRYCELNITDLVKEYTSGKYENTGFLIKARTEINNYIAFYSSSVGNESRKPKLEVTKAIEQPAPDEPDENAGVWLIVPCSSESEAEETKEKIKEVVTDVEIYIKQK